MTDERSKLATEMECLYRLIKSHSSASTQDLMRLSGLSEKRVRYHLSFFQWYGIACIPDTDDQITPKKELFMVSSENIEFVEGRFPTVFDFFYDAYVEVFAWDGED
jgi:hypothetical protein